jgi:hypothetical protein
MLFTGWGPIVLVVFLGIVFGFQSLFMHLTDERRFFLVHPSLGLSIMAFAAIVVWFLGRFMNRKPLVVMELDKQGRKLVPKARHMIWFIPAEYWGFILFVVMTLIILKSWYVT